MKINYSRKFFNVGVKNKLNSMKNVFAVTVAYNTFKNID